MFRKLVLLLVAALCLSASLTPARASVDRGGAWPSDRLANAYPAADLLLGRPNTPIIRLASLQDEPTFLRSTHSIQADELNLFRSVAIPVGPLSATKKWRVVVDAELAIGAGNGAAAALLAKAQSASTLPDLEAIALVNVMVNRAIRYRAERDDQWGTAMDTAARGSGDCEDYAILKHWLLLNLGFSDEQLQLILLKDRRRGINHAVLAVHLDAGTYILDNLTDRTTTDAAFLNYQPIVSFVGDKTYIHGFES